MDVEKDAMSASAAAKTGLLAARKPFREKSLQRLPNFNSEFLPCGDVFTHGIGCDNQFGLGPSHKEELKKPTLVRGLVGTQVVFVACGAFHTACVSSSGRVFTWGRSVDGALGRLPSPADCDPLLVEFPGKSVDVQAVSCGDGHTCALDYKRKIWTWGTYKDATGTIGIAGNNDRVIEQSHEPGLVQLPEPVADMASGCNHTVVRTPKGNVYVWGSNAAGQLGLAHGCRVTEFVASCKELPRANLECIEGSDGSETCVRLPSDTQARRVLRVLHTDGTERNASGMTIPALVSFLEVAGTTVILERLDHMLPKAEKRALLTPRLLTGSATGVFASCQGTFVTKGELAFGCGLNSDGQVGVGYTSQAVMTLQELPGLRSATWLGGGHRFACALLRDGGVLSWGCADLCGLGEAAGTSCVLRHTLVRGLPIIRTLRCGHYHTLACSTKGDIFSWGGGSSHQLGNGKSRDEPTPCLVSAASLDSRCVLLAAGGAQHSAELVWTSKPERRRWTAEELAASKKRAAAQHGVIKRPAAAAKLPQTRTSARAQLCDSNRATIMKQPARIMKRPAVADSQHGAQQNRPLKRPAVAQLQKRPAAALPNKR